MNVIWVISDTFRRDHLGCYGNSFIHTPSLDTFARNSVRFNRHYIASFPTMPTRADFLTGRWTGCFMNWEPLPKEQASLPELLREKGLSTAAVVDTPFYVRSNMNYDRGFRNFFEIEGQRHGERHDMEAAWRYESDRFAPRTFTRAMQWLEHHYKENFFLWIDTWDPHEPWNPPDYLAELYWPDYDGEVIKPAYERWQNAAGFTEEKVKKAHACYCGEITMVDTWFGQLVRRVENMGLMDNTAIIFTSDHGFFFGEHGGIFGKLITTAHPDGNRRWRRTPFFEELTGVPLIIHAPGTKPGVYSGLTSAIDIAPTVMDILGQEKPAAMEGHSLLPAMGDTASPGRDYVVSGPPITNRGTPVAWVDGATRITEDYSDITITTKEWTLLYAVQPGVSSLHHLPSDPRQETDVKERYPEVARKLHRQLIEFMREKKVPEHLIKPRLELL